MPSFSSCMVTVSTAAFLFSKTVLKISTTYSPSGAPGRLVLYSALLNSRFSSSAERATDGGQGILPLLLAYGMFECRGRVLPALSIVSGIHQAQPLLGRFLRCLFARCSRCMQAGGDHEDEREDGEGALHFWTSPENAPVYA